MAGRVNYAAIARLTERVVERAADRALASAQREAPVDTGRLRASGRIEGSGVTRRIIFGTPYIGYVIHGTSRQRANDFLTRGVLASAGGAS